MISAVNCLLLFSICWDSTIFSKATLVLWQSQQNLPYPRPIADRLPPIWSQQRCSMISSKMGFISCSHGVPPICSAFTRSSVFTCILMQSAMKMGYGRRLFSRPGTGGIFRRSGLRSSNNWRRRDSVRERTPPLSGFMPTMAIRWRHSSSDTTSMCLIRSFLTVQAKTLERICRTSAYSSQ